MKIATFNAASVRARLPILVEWLAENEPDVLGIQETKVENDKFPREEFEDLGYELALHGQKSWNGVALLTKGPHSNVRRGFEDDLFPEDARLISLEYQGVEIINAYCPNGSSVGSDKFIYKLRWFDRFHQLLKELYSPKSDVIFMGDINIAPTDLDVFDSKKMLGSVGHHPDEFARLDKIVEWGFTDLFRKFQSEGGHYSFWEFVIPNAVGRNLGWRIDHIYATHSLAEKCAACWIDKGPRVLERPSDHTFVIAELDI